MNTDWLFENMTEWSSPSERDETKKAFESGAITIEELENGIIVRGGKKKPLSGKKVKQMQNAWNGFNAAEQNKKAPANENKAPANENKGSEKPYEEKGSEKPYEEKGSEKPYEEKGSEDIQETYSNVDKYASAKTTTKYSPFFWKNAQYMTEDLSKSIDKETDPKKKEELIKQLKAAKRELYADHILKSLANLALTTSNWTGSEAGHNPGHKMVSSSVDDYKEAQRDAFKKQIEDIKDYDIKQQTNRIESINSPYNLNLQSTMNSKWKEWSNSNKFKDAKGNIDYYKMYESLDIEEKSLLESYMKSKMANLNESSSYEDVAKAFAGYEIGPIAVELIKNAANVTGKGVQSGWNYLKNKLGW